MSNLEMIETLCKLVEEQSKVIRHLATELAHARNLSDAEARMVTAVRDQYSYLLGADEIPDELYMDETHG